MPSPKYKARKPRSRPNVDVPFAPSFAAIASLVSFIGGLQGEIGDVLATILIFNKPLGSAEPADNTLKLFDNTGAPLVTQVWGYNGDPYGDDTRPGSSLWISYLDNGQAVDAFEYQPAGKVAGDTDGTGLPIRVRLKVNCQTAIVMQGQSA